jgi:hypothetical protein
MRENNFKCTLFGQATMALAMNLSVSSFDNLDLIDLASRARRAVFEWSAVPWNLESLKTERLLLPPSGFANRRFV